MTTKRAFVERGPLTPLERRRMALLDDGRRAFEQGSDREGRPYEVVRLVLLPVTPHRTERDARRIELELRISDSGSRWIEFIEDRG